MFKSRENTIRKCWWSFEWIGFRGFCLGGDEIDF